ncbi:MAG TPA: hypothetical protein VH333_05055 [Pseudonocardiaceae bacterium]|nr:hypothetical protein [Pseudonocardiaceae bacterium]
MAEPPAPKRGAIVTYLDSDTIGTPLRYGVSCGVGITDPQTDYCWIPVLRPYGGSTIVDPVLIVAVEALSTRAVRPFEKD